MIIGIVLIIGVLLCFNGKKKYNTDLETINPPMTKKERKALMFYRKTKCNCFSGSLFYFVCSERC